MQPADGPNLQYREPCPAHRFDHGSQEQVVLTETMMPHTALRNHHIEQVQGPHRPEKVEKDELIPHGESLRRSECVACDLPQNLHRPRLEQFLFLLALCQAMETVRCRQERGGFLDGLHAVAIRHLGFGAHRGRGCEDDFAFCASQLKLVRCLCSSVNVDCHFCFVVGRVTLLVDDRLVDASERLVP